MVLNIVPLNNCNLVYLGILDIGIAPILLVVKKFQNNWHYLCFEYSSALLALAALLFHASDV